jgi:hypothetical protein
MRLVRCMLVLTATLTLAPALTIGTGCLAGPPLPSQAGASSAMRLAGPAPQVSPEPTDEVDPVDDPCADPDLLDGLDDPCYVDVPEEEVRRVLSDREGRR